MSSFYLAFTFYEWNTFMNESRYIFNGTVSQISQNYEAAQKLTSLIMIIIKVPWAADHHIWMISKKSCESEDWNKDILKLNKKQQHLH